MKHTIIHSLIRARISFNRILSVSLSVIIVISLFTSSAIANVSVNTGTAPPQVSESFPVSVENAGSYVEPTNTFSDGTLNYYLVTQDTSKSTWTSVNYKGMDYDVAGHVYVLPVVNGKSDLCSDSSIFVNNVLPADSTFFFDDGTYTDSNLPAWGYVRLSNTNLSLVGLNTDASGEPKTTLTKDPVNGLMQRNTVMHKDVYYENLIFDGQGIDMVSGNRGESLFHVSGVVAPWDGSSGLVMRDCIIQNVGSANSTYGSNKNVAINFYCSTGQHNFINLKIRSIETQGAYGVVSFNQASGNYFKNLNIDGNLINSNAYSIKIETKGSALPINAINNIFTGNLVFTQSGQRDNVYIQDYGYNSTVPAAFRYAKYSTANGGNYFSAINVYSSIPAVTNNSAVLDLADNYWIVQSSGSVTDQLINISTVMNSVTSAGITVPGANVKLVSTGGVLPSFVVPDMGASRLVNIVAVAAASDSYNSTALVPLSPGAIITLQTTNASLVKLYNIDFDQNAKYTLQEAVSGISPAPTTDPNEGGTILDYPEYLGYATSADAKVTNSNVTNFENCRFTSLIREIEITSTADKVLVGSSTQLAARIKDSNTNSYTGTTFAGNIRDTANDQTINWFSSNPSIISVDKATGLASAHSIGTVTITAKAMDVNNDGEIEKPYAYFTMESETAVPTAAPTTAPTLTAVPTPPSGILGTDRAPTAVPTSTPTSTSTSTPTPTTGILGAAKTGESANAAVFPGMFIILGAAVFLVFFEKRRRYDSNVKNEVD